MDSFSHLFRGLLGITAFLAIAALFSTNRRRIDWKLVGVGMSLQLIFGLLVLHVGPVRKIFEAVGWGFTKIIGFTNEGTQLLFGWFNGIAGGNIPDIPFTAGGPVFVVSVLPTIIFFSALTSLLYRRPRGAQAERVPLLARTLGGGTDAPAGRRNEL